jgi:aminoglycoside 6-adenylyltransferase
MTGTHESKPENQIHLYENLITQVTVWAEPRQDMRAAIIIGSRARMDYPADAWADLDIIIITTEPEYYLFNDDWIQNIGPFLLSFTEPTTGGGMERRVLFEGMIDVDFAFFSEEKINLLREMSPEMIMQLQDIFGRGMRVLFDKDGIVHQLQSYTSSRVPYLPPTQQEFHDVISDFLYHCIWTAKHLRRGELWWAKECCDSHLKRLLLTMVEWHSRAVQGWNYDTWFRGRFLEKWADPRVCEGLRDAFAHYDEKDVNCALLATMELFRWLATETGEKLEYPYLAEADEKVTSWVRTCLSL